MIFKVAILQMPSTGRDVKKNTETLILKMQEAARADADILLVPECFITGYELPIENEEALADEDFCIKEICNAAEKFQLGVVATALTKGKEKPQNSAFVINKQGNILMKYAKVHTCDFADEMSEGLYFADFDMDEIRKYREEEMMGNTFRKVKAYEKLLDGEIGFPFMREGQQV